MEYNLVRNAYFDSLTTSGTGDVDLSWAQLELLMDGNTTSSGVNLTSPEVLFLETDLSQRIKIDEIRLYASDLGQSASIKFYYKNAEADSYSLLATQVGSCYYAIISDPSAPRYIRATVSGLTISLYEFEVVNDDYIVAFGEDGSQYAEYLGDSPIGEEGDPQAVAIFNNGSSAMPADAYVCIDYTGETADEYIKISETANGTYYGVNDGVLIEDNVSSSEYTWDMSSTLVGRNMVVNDEVKNAGRLLSLPTVVKSNFTNTSDNCWDYDRVNNKLYVVASDSTIKLYELDINSSTWVYVGEIYPGVSDHSGHVSIGYLDGCIYASCNATTTGPAFGKFDLNTKNWTTLSSPVITSAQTVKYNICSDYERYIYLNRCHTDKSATKYFGRYDTVSGTWSALNNGYRWYGLYGGSFSNFHMWYDTNRDRLYAVAASTDDAGTGENRYIQIYNPSTNSWTDLLNVYNIIGKTTTNWAFSYDSTSDLIWIMFASQSNTIYKYSLSTAQVTSYTISYTLSSLGVDYSTHIIAVPYISDMPGILVGNVSEDRSYVYHYQAVGTYTSPIFQLDAPNDASYFLVDGTAVSGTGSISYDEGSYNGTIRIKSSTIEPMVAQEVYTATMSTYVYIHRWLPYINQSTTNWISDNVSYGSWRTASCLAYDKYSGNLTILTHFNDNLAAVIYTTYNVKTGSRVGYTIQYTYTYYAYKMMYTNNNSVWTYGYGAVSVHPTLNHVLLGAGNNYSVTLLFSLNESNSNFVRDFCAEWDGMGVWYTHKIDDLLIHRDYLGNQLQSVILQTAGPICPTRDNGCWVADTNANVLKAYRYDFDGGLVKTVTLDRAAYAMATDWDDGFWYSVGYYVYHVTSAGVEDVPGVLMPLAIRSLEGAHDGCFVYMGSQVKFINYASKAVTRTWTTPSSQPTTIAALSLDYDDFLNFKLDGTFMPASYDPVWGTDGSLEWIEVRKDGYFLPKIKYHQTEVTLRGDATLEKIIMPPAIKVQDIASQTYKNMYIKTDIPADADITDYEARLKTWWGVDA